MRKTIQTYLSGFEIKHLTPASISLCFLAFTLSETYINLWNIGYIIRILAPVILGFIVVTFLIKILLLRELEPLDIITLLILLSTSL